MLTEPRETDELSLNVDASIWQNVLMAIDPESITLEELEEDFKSFVEDSAVFNEMILYCNEHSLSAWEDKLGNLKKYLKIHASSSRKQVMAGLMVNGIFPFTDNLNSDNTSVTHSITNS